MAKGSMTTNSTVDLIDKTLSIENAPADAKAVGDIVLDRTKETPQPIFYSKAEVDALLTQHTKDTLLAAYPVGSLYMSAEATSPASLFGGTWEQIKDRFILAAGDTYAAGSTGGEATHTLTISEMPSHKHNVLIGNNSGNRDVRYIPYVDSDNAITWDGTDPCATSWTGGGASHNNLPPYLTAYIWKRIS